MTAQTTARIEWLTARIARLESIADPTAETLLEISDYRHELAAEQSRQ